jgi:hypothetical protein
LGQTQLRKRARFIIGGTAKEPVQRFEGHSLDQGVQDVEALTIGLLVGLTIVGLTAGVAISRPRRPSLDVNETTFWHWVTFEFERARRQEAPLALVRIRSLDAQQAAFLAARLRQLGLRPTDQVGVEGADVYLLAPGIDRTRATTMIARVVASEFDNRWVRIAVFPDDAITERALIDLVNSPPGRHVPAPFGAARQAS